MFKSIFSVSFFTLLSRVIGFVRDAMFAHILGAGVIADAFIVAFKFPNFFRAFFADGAFNAAFLPRFAKVTAEQGKNAAYLFADHIFAWMMLFQAVFLILVMVATPVFVSIFAWGLTGERFAYAIDFTRITFPYLAFMTMVILLSAMLNAQKKYAVAAAAPILLNVSMIIALLLAQFFITPGHAASWGVVVSGLLQFLLLGFAAIKSGCMVEFKVPRITPDTKLFWKAFLPAALGAGGVQLALFADTFIVSFAQDGAISALYYADRINQLPLGVISIAVGTVLLSEMSTRIAKGDEAGARNAQLRGMELTFLCTMPFLVAFTMIPEIIMKAAFMRGKFTEIDALNAASALSAYAIGLTAFMLIRSATVTFSARGDTKTPVKAMFISIAVNIALKIILIKPMGFVGVALATSIGAWVNWVMLIYFARKQKLIAMDDRARDMLVKIALAGLILAFALIGTDLLLIKVLMPTIHDIPRLFILMTMGAISFGGAVFLLLGKTFIRDFKKMRAGKI
jgi:putative peptidoglycan lipid II flippase